MDFAIVPGITAYEALLERIMQARSPKTTIIKKSGVTSIADFLNELDSQSLQGGDLIVGAHASRRTFAVAFDTTTPVPADSNGKDYEMLEAVNAKGVIHIPASVRSPNTSFHLKGCQIGADQARPFLVLLKTALDNPQSLTAPKYLHVLIDDAGQGVNEYMRYTYEVMTPTAFDKRSDIVSAFQSGSFMQGVEKGVPQVKVPAGNWEKWVPTQVQLDAEIDDIKLNFTVRLVPTIRGAAVVWHSAVFSAFPDSFTWPLDMTGKTVPPDDAGRIALLKPSLLSSPRLQFPPVHLFPYYVRMGFTDFDSFYKGLDWSVSLKGTAPNQQLEYVGRQLIYRLEIPVVKKGTTDLIYNYYPKTGPPVMHFREDNASYEMFGTV